MKRIQYTIYLIILCFVALEAQQDYNIRFADEFDSDKTLQNGKDRLWKTVQCWEQDYNWGIHFFTPYVKDPTNNACSQGGRNHIVQDGKLTLLVKDEPGTYIHTQPDSCGYDATINCKHFDFTSGQIYTVKKDFLYGYYEIKCKIPWDGKYLWPGFWLWDGGGDAYREIDIFEFGFGRRNAKHDLYTAIHLAGKYDYEFGAAINAYSFDPYKIPSNIDITNEYHTYALKWTPEALIWYFDGKVVNHVIHHNIHEPMHLLLTLAVHNNGSKGKDRYIKKIRKEIKRQGGTIPMDIDYIRVYDIHDFKSIHKREGIDYDKIRIGKIQQKMVAGDFFEDGKTDVMIISDKLNPKGGGQGWITCHTFEKDAWQIKWTNNGNGQLGNIPMKAGDKYLAADIDGDNKTELFTIGKDDRVMALDFEEQTWGSWAGNWHFAAPDGLRLPGAYKEPDRLTVGDLDGDGEVEWVYLTPSGENLLLGEVTRNKNDLGSIRLPVPASKIAVGDFDSRKGDELFLLGKNGRMYLYSLTGNNKEKIWEGSLPSGIDVNGKTKLTTIKWKEGERSCLAFRTTKKDNLVLKFKK